MRALLAPLALAAALSSAPIASADAATDPVVGTWQLNVAKSTFTAGPALKSQTRTYTQSGNSFTLAIKSVGADGKETTSQSTYALDGKDYPVTGNANYDTISGTRVNSRTCRFTQKRAGQVIGHTTRTVSKDAKTLVAKTDQTNAKGEKVQNVLVFDRQ